MPGKGQSVADQLHSAAVHLVRFVASVDAQMGLTPARASAMSVLVFGGPRTVGQLAAVEGVRSPTMTSLVNGLISAGLARKRSSADDGRIVVVEATAKGRRLLEAGRSRRVAKLRQMMEQFTEEDLDCLERASLLIERAVDVRRPERN